jgi:hypothetical protein
MYDVHSISEKWTQTPPFQDEIFSSWFTRISKLNCVNANFLLNMLIGTNHSFQDIERMGSAKKSLIEKIKAHVDIARSSFTKLQLAPILYLDGAETVQKYCPLCLDNDPVPYFRLYWLLPFMMICPVHNVFLLNQCPTCHEPISYWSTRWNQFIHSCFYCNSDLRKFHCVISLNKKSDKLQLQNDLLEIYTCSKYQGIKINQTVFFNKLNTIMNSRRSKIDLQNIIQNFSKSVSSLEKTFLLFDQSFWYSLPPSVVKSTVSKEIENEKKTENKLSSNLDREEQLEIAESRYQTIKPYIISYDKTWKNMQRIAKEGSVSLATFYKWVKLYGNNGLAALKTEIRNPGRLSSDDSIRRFNITTRTSFEEFLQIHDMNKGESTSVSYQNCFTCTNGPPRLNKDECHKCAAAFIDKNINGN